MHDNRASAVIIDVAATYDLYREILFPVVDRTVGMIMNVEGLLVAGLMEVMSGRDTPHPTINKFLEDYYIPTDIGNHFKERFEMLANNLFADIAICPDFESEPHTLEIQPMTGYRLKIIANRNGWNGAPDTCNGPTATLQQLHARVNQLRESEEEQGLCQNNARQYMSL